MGRALLVALAGLLVTPAALAHSPLSPVEGLGALAVGTLLVTEVESGPFAPALLGLASGDFLAAEPGKVRRIAPDGTERWATDVALPGSPEWPREASEAVSVFFRVPFRPGEEEALSVAVLDHDGRVLRLERALPTDRGVLSADAAGQCGVVPEWPPGEVVTAWSPGGAVRWSYPLADGQVGLDVLPLPDGRLAAIILTSGSGTVDLRLFDAEGRVVAAWGLAGDGFNILAIGSSPPDTARLALDADGGLLLGWTTYNQIHAYAASLEGSELRQGHLHPEPFHNFGPVSGLARAEDGSALVFGSMRVNAFNYYAAVAKFPLSSGCEGPCRALWVRPLVNVTNSITLGGSAEGGRIHVVAHTGCTFVLQAVCPVPAGVPRRTTLRELFTATD